MSACGGGSQIADTPTSEAKIVAKAEVESSPTKEPPKPEPTNPSTQTPLPIPSSTPVPSAPTQVPPTEVPAPEPTEVPAPEPTAVPTPEPTAVPTPTRLRSEGHGLINLKEGIVSGDVLLDFDKECGVNGFPWAVGQLDNDQIRIKLTKDLASDFTLSEASAPSELGISNFLV